MKCLYIGFMFFAYNYVTWSQEISSPTNEETSHVCDGNSMTVTDHIPISIPDSCPKDMLLYSGHSAEEPWVCDCRFLYFPLDDSCYERILDCSMQKINRNEYILIQLVVLYFLMLCIHLYDSTLLYIMHTHNVMYYIIYSIILLNFSS